MLTDFFGGKQLNKDVDPDEAVAIGAAMQASVLLG
jgi:L1 cell adhesion molecule like protein